MARKYTPTAKFGTIEGYTSAHAYGDLITRSVGKGEYSQKLTIRLSLTIHQSLVILSKQQIVSLK